MIRTVMTFTAAIAFAQSASAQLTPAPATPSPATTAVAPGGKLKDPNARICRTEGVTGSRLNQRRRCMTAFEWAELARLDRQSIERTQANRYNGNEGAGGVLNDPFGRNN